MVTKAPDGEYIGISNGTFAFDTNVTNRPDGNLKRQAGDKLKRGDINGAESLWKQALAQDTNDAETLIYQEDQRILDSQRSYFTLVIGTILTGNLSSTGRDSLQGAYVAQKEYNDSCSKLPDCVQLRLLVANSGTGDTPSAEVAYASLVMEQIVQAARSDRSIVGVMGWSVSSSSFYMATVLGTAHIPMVSPTASVDAPTQVSSYFFRVAPSNKSQAMAGAQYAEQKLHARHVVIFADPVDKYSESLANDFQQQFTADGNTIVAIENYTVGKPDTIASRLSDALSNNPDLIYFAGHTIDVGALLTNLPITGPFANIQVLGGDGLYELGGYPTDARGKLYRLHFTAFAYPDEWHFLAPSAQQPAFFNEYPQAFDSQGQHPGDYGYGRADNSTILSYDAMQALLTASTLAFAGGKSSFTTDELQQALTRIQAVQGVSGQIVFGPDGNPLNKTVVLLHFDAGNHIQYDQAYGCFLRPQPTASPNASCS
jgi:ABC-type branched-subunit amino acid transport system substrate-binding protein